MSNIRVYDQLWVIYLKSSAVYRGFMLHCFAWIQNVMCN